MWWYTPWSFYIIIKDAWGSTIHIWYGSISPFHLIWNNDYSIHRTYHNFSWFSSFPENYHPYLLLLPLIFHHDVFPNVVFNTLSNSLLFQSDVTISTGLVDFLCGMNLKTQFWSTTIQRCGKFLWMQDGIFTSIYCRGFIEKSQWSLHLIWTRIDRGLEDWKFLSQKK